MTQSVFSKLSFSALLFSLSLASLHSPGFAEEGDIELDGIAAVVNDDIITHTELDAEVKRIASELSRRNTQAPPRDVLAKQVLERLINRKIQLQTARRANIAVDDETLNRTLKNIAAESNLTLAQFRQVLVRDGVSFETFRENIRDEVTLNRFYQRQIDRRVNISEADISAFLETQRTQGNVNIEYEIGHILIAVPENASGEEVSAARGKAENIVVRLNDGENFAEIAVAESNDSRALDGGNLGWRNANELPTLFTNVIPVLDKGEISEVIKSTSGFHIVKLLDTRDGDTKIVQQTKARHILVATTDRSSDEAKALADEMREDIIEGGDFAEMAKEHSDDLGSGKEGGNLGWISPGQTVAPFESAMNTLQAGEISQPVESRFGWHIIEVMERRDFDATENVKRNEARQALLEQRIGEERRTELRRLRDDAYVEVRI